MHTIVYLSCSWMRKNAHYNCLLFMGKKLKMKKILQDEPFDEIDTVFSVFSFLNYIINATSWIFMLYSC